MLVFLVLSFLPRVQFRDHGSDSLQLLKQPSISISVSQLPILNTLNTDAIKPNSSIMSGFEDINTPIAHAPGWVPMPGQRPWPCKRCANSAVAGRGDGVCVQSPDTNKCLHCEQARRGCVPITKASRKPVRQLVEARQVGLIGLNK